eukprot:414778-Rhodomonas_salina.1
MRRTCSSSTRAGNSTNTSRSRRPSPWPVLQSLSAVVLGTGRSMRTSSGSRASSDYDSSCQTNTPGAPSVV